MLAISLSFRIVVVFVLSLSIVLKAIKLSAVLGDNKVAAFLDRPCREECSGSQRDLRIILDIVLVQVSTLCEVIIQCF